MVRGGGEESRFLVAVLLGMTSCLRVGHRQELECYGDCRVMSYGRGSDAGSIGGGGLGVCGRGGENNSIASIFLCSVQRRVGSCEYFLD